MTETAINKKGIKFFIGDKVTWESLNCGKITKHSGHIIQFYARRVQVSCADKKLLGPHLDWIEHYKE